MKEDIVTKNDSGIETKWRSVGRLRTWIITQMSVDVERKDKTWTKVMDLKL
jgi:hypothetical protein